MNSKRKRHLQVLALRYIADHMEAVLAVEGPHELVETDEEDEFLEKFFKREADKLRDRAHRMAKSLLKAV